MSRENEPFVVVHVGAGKHATSKLPKYSHLCHKACDFAMERLLEHGGVRRAAVETCKLLEDSHLTNAGTGSQLNANGHVECDASIIDSVSMVGSSVAAVSGVLNPIEVAEKLGNSAIDGEKDKWGRSRPLFLRGKGAEMYAEKTGCRCVDPKEMITPEAEQLFLQWGKMMQEEEINDTVGVICGNDTMVVAVSSSGGVALKEPGRVGPAALIGAGTAIKKTDSKLVACCATGFGEDIITMNLASLVCDNLIIGDDDHSTITKVFKSMSTDHHLQSTPPCVGAVSVSIEDDCRVLTYAHTTDSMILAYRSASSKTIVVKSGDGGKPGSLFTGGSAL